MIDGRFTQGTTPTHCFVLPFPLDTVSDWNVTYESKNGISLTKTKEDCLTNENDNSISSTLTQEESFMFDIGIIELQLRVALNSGAILCTPRYRLEVEKGLDRTVFEI